MHDIFLVALRTNPGIAKHMLTPCYDQQWRLAALGGPAAPALLTAASLGQIDVIAAADIECVDMPWDSILRAAAAANEPTVLRRFHVRCERHAAVTLPTAVAAGGVMAVAAAVDLIPHSPIDLPQILQALCCVFTAVKEDGGAGHGPVATAAMTRTLLSWIEHLRQCVRPVVAGMSVALQLACLARQDAAAALLLNALSQWKITGELIATQALRTTWCAKEVDSREKGLVPAEAMAKLRLRMRGSKTAMPQLVGCTQFGSLAMCTAMRALLHKALTLGVQDEMIHSIIMKARGWTQRDVAPQDGLIST